MYDWSMMDYLQLYKNIEITNTVNALTYMLHVWYPLREYWIYMY